MIILYVIRSEVNKELYVGITNNLERRLAEHEKGKNRYTKGLRPWKHVHQEEYPDYASARKQEKYYKSGSGKEKLKRMIFEKEK
jgi:putative endonuclease